MSSNTLLTKLFNKGGMTPHQKAVHATNIIEDDPSLLSKDVIAPALSVLYDSEHAPLFDVLKEHGAHLDQTLSESETLDQYCETVFASSVPHC